MEHSLYPALSPQITQMANNPTSDRLLTNSAYTEWLWIVRSHPNYPSQMAVQVEVEENKRIDLLVFELHFRKPPLHVSLHFPAHLSSEQLDTVGPI